MRRVLIVTMLVAASMAVSPSSRADADDRAACVAAAGEGQKLRDDAKLTAARERFIACAKETCPAIVSRQCVNWLQQVEQQIPTVTFHATVDGKEAVDLEVFVDGVSRVKTLDGRPMPLDPGVHKFRYVHAKAEREDSVLVIAGQRNRVVEIELKTMSASVPASTVPKEQSPPPEERPSKFRVPPLAFVGLGVGVAGAVGTVLFATSAKSEVDELQKDCSPQCTDSQVDPARTKLLLANVSLGVGVAGLAFAGVVTILANRSSASAPSAAARYVAPPRVVPVVGAGESSGWAGVRGAF